MIAIKTRSAFTTAGMLQETRRELCLESYTDEGSTVLLPTGAAGQEAVGAWAVLDGWIYRIAAVLPDGRRTRLRLEPPHRAFDRLLLYEEPEDGETAAGFLAAALETEFRLQPDPMYRIAALDVRAWSQRAFFEPDEVQAARERLREGDALGDVLWSPAAYIARLRALGVYTEFDVAGDTLRVTVRERAPQAVSLRPGDGHTILDSRAYGDADTVAKVTVLRAGTPEDFYLTEAGEITRTAPRPRAAGLWKKVMADEDADDDAVAALAERTFGDRAGAMKVTLWSDRPMRLGDVVTLRLDGKRTVGRVSRVGESSGNPRRHYTLGDLATSLTEQARRIS